MRRRGCRIVSALLVALLGATGIFPSRANPAPPTRELTSAQVKDAIERAQMFLAATRNADGSYGQVGGWPPGGTTGLALLALLNSGLPANDPVVADGLRFMRRSSDPQGPYETYQTSLEIMTLVAARQWSRDKARIERLARKLESYQVTAGPTSGMWPYGRTQRRY